MKQDMTPYGKLVRRILTGEHKMKNMEHIYSDTIGTMIPKYVTSTHPSDIHDGCTVYEWIEAEAAYVNGAEEIVFYETVSEDGYFVFGKAV